MKDQVPIKKRGGPRKANPRARSVGIRLTPDLYSAVQLVAQVSCRTVSSQIEYATHLYIQKNFPQALIPGAKLVFVTDEAPVEGTGSAE